jgi:hypothetical protein
MLKPKPNPIIIILKIPTNKIYKIKITATTTEIFRITWTIATIATIVTIATTTTKPTIVITIIYLETTMIIKYISINSRVQDSIAIISSSKLVRLELFLNS